MKQKNLIKLLISLLLVISLVLPVVPVNAASSSVRYGSVYSLKQRMALSKIEATWWKECNDFNIIVGTKKSVKLTFPEELDANGVKVTYKSADKKIVTVSKNGELKAKKKGETKVTIYFKDGYGNTMTFVSKVVVVKNTKELKKQNALDNFLDINLFVPEVKKGEKALIEVWYPYDRHLNPDVTGYGPEEIKSITYKVKNTKIASVTKDGARDGYIEGKKKGKTELTIIFKDIYGYSYSFKRYITVR